MFEDLAAGYKVNRQSLRKRIIQLTKDLDKKITYDRAYETATNQLNDLIMELAMVELKLSVLNDLDHDIDNDPKLLLD